MSEAEKKRIAEQFIEGLRTRDGKLLNSIMHSDVVWSLPGRTVLANEARGVEAILGRANAFKTYNVNLAILYVLYGYEDVALSLHNTGRHDGKILDEHLTTVLHLEDGKIHRIDTYISDVSMLNGYFI